MGLRDAGVDEWLVDTVMSTYKGARTVVLTDDGVTEEFEVGVGLHQGSALSPLLFIVVMDYEVECEVGYRGNLGDCEAWSTEVVWTH